MTNSNEEQRKAEIAKEFGISIDAVTLCPYKKRSNEVEPSPWEINIREKIETEAKRLKKSPDEVILIDHDFTYYGSDFYKGKKPIKTNMSNIIRRQYK